MNSFKYILIVIALVPPFFSQAQIGQGGTPFSFSEKFQNKLY